MALYAELGVKGIEICERKLSTDAARAREQLAMVHEAGRLAQEHHADKSSVKVLQDILRS